MPFVLDASMTLSWLFEDEFDEHAAKCMNLLETEQAIVPQIWVAEVCNIILIAEKKGRINHYKSSRFIAELEKMPIKVDDSAFTLADLKEVRGFADAMKLTSYDALYLGLALKLNLPIATKDNTIRLAAQKIEIVVI